MRFLNQNTKSFLVKIAPAIFVILIFFNIAAIPQALSQSSKTTVVLYEQYTTKQFNEEQVVKLRGQVIYHPPGGFPVGISNVYFKIINQYNGQVIYDGYTGSDGLFSYDWSAVSYGKRTINLQAIFLGSGGYEYAESNTLELEIFSQHKETYHDTYLTLEVKNSSTSGYIRVHPKLTSRGSDLNTRDVEIYVDGNYITTVSSNTLSSEIFTDTGLHTIKAVFPQLPDDDEPLVFYESSSDQVSFTVSDSGGSGSTETYHDTYLTLEVKNSSTSGYIRVHPKLTSRGSDLNTRDVEIYVDGNYITTVSSNTLSSEIFTDTGLHTIKAVFPQLPDDDEPLVFYESSSDQVSFTVSGIIQPPPPLPPPPPPDGSAIAIVVIIVAIVGAGAGIALSKRKKKLPAIQTPYVKSSPTPIKPDDTQFWVCPHCGKDTEMYLGKQYCRNCKVYL